MNKQAFWDGYKEDLWDAGAITAGGLGTLGLQAAEPGIIGGLGKRLSPQDAATTSLVNLNTEMEEAGKKRMDVWTGKAKPSDFPKTVNGKKVPITDIADFNRAFDEARESLLNNIDKVKHNSLRASLRLPSTTMAKVVSRGVKLSPLAAAILYAGIRSKPGRLEKQAYGLGGAGTKHSALLGGAAGAASSINSFGRGLAGAVGGAQKKVGETLKGLASWRAKSKASTPASGTSVAKGPGSYKPAAGQATFTDSLSTQKKQTSSASPASSAPSLPA